MSGGGARAARLRPRLAPPLPLPFQPFQRGAPTSTCVAALSSPPPNQLRRVAGALGRGKLVPTEYAAYRVEPGSGEEYCYVTFRFDSVAAQ